MGNFTTIEYKIIRVKLYGLLKIKKNKKVTLATRITEAPEPQGNILSIRCQFQLNLFQNLIPISSLATRWNTLKQDFEMFLTASGIIEKMYYYIRLAQEYVKILEN